MTSPNPSPLDALAGLLEERRRYENWLEQLSARSSESPQHVVERVRSDYVSRLQTVTSQLRARASDLETSAGEFEQRSAALLTEETARRDERAEAELRSAVGEYSSEEAQGILTRCDEEIARLSSDRDAVNAELTRIRDVLESVKEPAPPPPAPMRPTATPAAASAPVPPPPHAPPPLHGTDPSAFDELAFLQSVVQPRDAAPHAASGSDFAPPSPVGQPRRQAPAGEAAHREASAPGGSSSRTAAATPENLVSFLKDAPTEQVKTLRCQECGTMNYPTEWYCERCGGELAAM